jgi:hypothetical protein
MAAEAPRAPPELTRRKRRQREIPGAQPSAYVAPTQYVHARALSRALGGESDFVAASFDAY